MSSDEDMGRFMKLLNPDLKEWTCINDHDNDNKLNWVIE